jgi:hypothetical protein
MADQHVFLTVPEVMARLRLSRTTVYEQARLYLATDGAEGLPCRRFGRSLRFPAAVLDGAAPTVAPPKPPDVIEVPEPRRARRSAHHVDQLRLLPPS